MKTRKILLSYKKRGGKLVSLDATAHDEALTWAFISGAMEAAKGSNGASGRVTVASGQTGEVLFETKIYNDLAFKLLVDSLLVENVWF